MQVLLKCFVEVGSRHAFLKWDVQGNVEVEKFVSCLPGIDFEIEVSVSMENILDTIGYNIHSLRSIPREFSCEWINKSNQYNRNIARECIPDDCFWRGPS